MPRDEVIEIERVGLVTLVITVIIFLNIVLAIVTMFRERREPASLWAWILVMFFIPLLGFLLWMFVGRRLTRRKIFEKLQGSSTDYGELALEQQKAIAAGVVRLRQPGHRAPPRRRRTADERPGRPADRGQPGAGLPDGREKFDALIDDIAGRHRPRPHLLLHLPRRPARHPHPRRPHRAGAGRCRGAAAATTLWAGAQVHDATCRRCGRRAARSTTSSRARSR